MKKIISLTMFLFLFFTVTNAQTTIQDYDYVTKRLKNDLFVNGEIKSGYSMDKIGENQLVTQGQDHIRTTQLRYFKKEGKILAFILECKETKNNFSFYLCIPVTGSDQQIWDKYFADLRSVEKEWHLLFSWAFSILLSQNYSK
ncbi:MAG: hypothetical protein ABI685_06920 [Ferruginibacter sp.]